MDENPLVQRLRQHLQRVTQGIQDASSRNPAGKVLLVYLAPGVVLATLLLTVVFGAGPGVVGLLALTIPAYIFFSLTDFS